MIPNIIKFNIIHYNMKETNYNHIGKSVITNSLKSKHIEYTLKGMQQKDS